VDVKPLIALAHRQHGCLSYSQAVEAGVRRSQWRSLIDDGLVVPVRRGVVRLAGAQRTSLQTIAAAVLAAGDDVIVSHATAAHVWDERIDRAIPVHVTLTDHRRTLRLPDVVAHHTTDAVDLRPVMRRGIPISNPLRVLCDVGATEPTLVATVLERFMISGYVRPDSARAALDRHAKRGRDGIRALRAALDAYPLGNKPPDSVLEPAMARLVERFHLPTMTFHQVVRGWEVDFRVDDTPVIVECDGWSTHGLDRDQFERDRRKDAELRAAGYLVCRYTWQQVTKQPRNVADNLSAVLSIWAPDVIQVA
jgi:very-short-patch-repair endonuclease